MDDNSDRKNGLFKKAYELGVLCSVDVAVIIFDEKPGQQQKLYEYSSSNIKDIVKRHVRFQGEKDSRGPSDFSGEGGAGGKMEDADEDGDGDEEDDDEPQAKKSKKGGKDDRKTSASTTHKSSTSIPISSSRHTHLHSHKRKRSRSRSLSLSPSRSRSSSPASPRQRNQVNPLSLPIPIPPPRSDHEYGLPPRGSITSPHTSSSRPDFDSFPRSMGNSGYQSSGNGYQFPFQTSSHSAGNVGVGYSFMPPSPAPSSGSGVPGSLLQTGGSFNDIMESRGVFGPSDRGVFEAPNRPIFGGGGGVSVMGGMNVPGSGEVLDVKTYRQMLLDQQIQAQQHHQQQSQSNMSDLFAFFESTRGSSGGGMQQQHSYGSQPPPYSLNNAGGPVDWPPTPTGPRQSASNSSSQNWLDFLSGAPPQQPSGAQHDVSVLGDIFASSGSVPPRDDDSDSEYDPSRTQKKGRSRITHVS
ncbi:hypothetical protein VNI00_010543 [Paramarasmius palmivorus]|uniref:MADS-box domain-containing protein n=1 Tax=Paramarasmius palmivorus TaxID=297713 RepID=A0AAW0CKD6_9AGAR